MPQGFNESDLSDNKPAILWCHQRKMLWLFCRKRSKFIAFSFHGAGRTKTDCTMNILFIFVFGSFFEQDHLINFWNFLSAKISGKLEGSTNIYTETGNFYNIFILCLWIIISQNLIKVFSAEILIQIYFLTILIMVTERLY